MVTAPDFSVPHTQLWCLWKEDPLAFTIHHPELIMLKNIKSYRHWSALIKIVPHWIFFLFHIKIHEISPGEIQKSNGLKVTCLMSLYFKSEEDTMKNEIPAAIFLVPPPPSFEEKYLPNYWRVLLHTIQSVYMPLQFFNYKTVDRILDIVSVIYLSTRKIQ